MKILYKIAVFVSIIGVFTACENNEEDYELFNVATPVTMSMTEVRSSVKIMPPQSIQESGKIYVYGDYLFVNDKGKGIHIIDNSIPTAPKKINFIKILGNVDIAVKDDMLYADSYADLVVFNIANIKNIVLVNRLKDVLPNFYIEPIFEATDNLPRYIKWENVKENHVVVDWKIAKAKMRTDQIYWWRFGELASASASDASMVGQGGSLARFMIVSDYLYAVNDHQINIFGIQNLNLPVKIGEEPVGWGIETIFNKGNYLYLGSTTGMYIYDIQNLSKPKFMSRIAHIRACDPVVVDENDMAFVTLRAGNLCGSNESLLEVIDVSNKLAPKKLKDYVMDNPYGLGVSNNLLFVCDGTSGLKVYNKSNVMELQLVNHFKNINAFDVIPLYDKLILIANEVVYQYKYTGDSVQLLSVFNLN